MSRFTLFFPTISFVFIIGEAFAFGSTPTSKTGRVAVRASFLATPPPRIDGAGDDLAWRDAPRHSVFVQFDPEEGASPSEATSVAAVYDDAALYFLVDAHDSHPESVTGRLTRRDAASASDWLHVWLDTYGDKRTAYRFSLNPSGVKQDARVVDGHEEDTLWDAVWDGRATTSTHGWTAEFRIPLSQLRYDFANAVWGIQVRRDILRHNEQDYLSPQPKESDRHVAHFGELSGLDALPQAWPVSVVPYVTAQVAYGAATPKTGSPLPVSGGAEGRAALGPSLTLLVAGNPDFSQVEADPNQLNLSLAEYYLEERRPFFLEGREQLTYQLIPGDGSFSKQGLYYSRRIGRTPIVGAGALIGKTSDGWSIGLLDAVSSKGTDADGIERPLSNAFVARLSREMNDGAATLGAVVTHLANDVDAASAKTQLAHAVSGGMDLDYSFGDYRLVARLFGTHLQGSVDVIRSIERSNVHLFQRPDANHLGLDGASSLSGWGLSAFGGKLSGRTVRYGVGTFVASPGLDSNPLGYLIGSDMQLGFLWFQLRSDDAGAWHRRWQVNFNADAGRTFGGEIFTTSGNVNGRWILPSNIQIHGGIARSFEALDVTRLRGGPALLVPGATRGWVGIATDPRLVWDVTADVSAHRYDGDQGASLDLTAEARFRPTTWVELSCGPNFSLSSDPIYAISEPPDAPVVSKLDAQVFGVVARANITFTPDLSLQFYANPYFVGGIYSDIRNVVAPRADEFSERFSPRDASAPPFVYAEFSASAVLRWEYTLGSTLFVVWKHHQQGAFEDRGTLALGRDIGDLVRLPVNDSIAIKLSYYFSP